MQNQLASGRLRTRLAAMSRSAVARFMNLTLTADRIVRDLHTGIWLGVLDRIDLYDVCSAHYSKEDRYGAHSYLTSGLFPWETDSIKRYFPPKGRILVLGAGTGREVLALSSKGYEVEGFECEPPLVDLGNRLLKEMSSDCVIHQCDRDKSPTTGTVFDGVIIGWGAYSHVFGKDTRLALLRDLRSSMAVGAPILLSFLFADKDSGGWRAVTAIGNTLRRIRLCPERVEVGDYLYPTCVHFFDLAEIGEELNAAGFKVQMCESAEYSHAIAFKS